MRISLFVLLLALLPCALAGTTEGWHYPGEEFAVEGAMYRVAGTDPELLLLETPSGLRLIRLGECVMDGLTEYCYPNSAHPNDDAHTRYEGGEVHYAYYISITTATPSVEVTRDVSEDEPGVGEQVTITVTVKNDGDRSINQFSYAEQIPEGLSGRPVSFTLKAIPPGGVERHTYRVVPVAYGTYSLKPDVSYAFEGTRYDLSVPAETIEVESPVKAVRTVPKALRLDEDAFYVLNLSNEGDEELVVAAVVVLPDGLSGGTPKGAVQRGKEYVVEKRLRADEHAAATIPFSASAGGAFAIPLTVTFRSGDLEVTERHNDSVAVDGAALEGSIGLVPAKSVFSSGERLTVRGIVKNGNGAITFSRIEGSLAADGLFRPVVFEHEAFPPGRTLTEAEKELVLPEVATATNYTVVFSGSYQTPKRRDASFTESRIITVLPAIRSVRVTHAVEPSEPRPGETLRVIVSVENLLDRELALDAHEQLGLEAQGETYKELTLPAGAVQELYSYNLTVPANSTGLQLITSVRVEGAPAAEEFATEIMFAAGAAGAQESVVGGPAAPSEEEPGFFTRMWDYLKGWFA